MSDDDATRAATLEDAIVNELARRIAASKEAKNDLANDAPATAMEVAAGIAQAGRKGIPASSEANGAETSGGATRLEIVPQTNYDKLRH